VSPYRRLAVAGTAGTGVLTLASALSPTVPSRERMLERFEPGSAQAVAHAVAACGGVALLALSLGVARRRRRADQAAIVILWLLAAVHAAKGLDYEEALLGLGLALALRGGLHAFGQDRSPSPRLLAALAALVAVTTAYATTVTLLMIRGHGLGIDDAFVRAGQAVLDGGLRLAGSAGEALHVLSALALVAIGLWVRALLAPSRARDGHEPAAHARAAAIVARHGVDSLAPFVLRADKAFFFSGGGVLAYRTLRETAVVSGDPVGPPGSARAIVADFLAYAGRRGWDVVLTGAGAEHLDGYAELGLRSLQIGSEAIADPQRFSLEGRAIRKVRQSVHRIERRGWSVAVVEADELTPELVDELAGVEHAWRRAQPRLYGFAMCMDRLWGAPEDAGGLYVVGRDPDGHVTAFLRFVPYRAGLSLDAMRRVDDVPNGLNEALVVAAIAHARQRDVRELSLNFAGFAHVMAAEALTSRQRLLRWGLRLAHGRFQLERLVRFNDKFAPEWRPRYLVYTGHTRLALAALRVLQAEAYIRPPRRRVSPTAWRPDHEPVRVSWTGP
jgi:lysyl-tRNA synthetase, class II